MPGLRVLVLGAACAIGLVLGLSTATLADATVAACGSGAHRGGPAAGAAVAGVVCGSRAESGPQPDVGRFAAVATRHDPAENEPPPGVANPATDRAVVLLVGWVMLVLVGGGLIVGGTPRRRSPRRPPPAAGPYRAWSPAAGPHRAGSPRRGSTRAGSGHRQPEAMATERLPSK